MPYQVCRHHSIGFAFGGKEKAAPAQIAKVEDRDSDRDGVRDSLDKCPKTRSGAVVDKNGCPPKRVVVFASEPKAEERVKAAAIETDEVILAFEDIHFDFDQSTLKPEAQKILKRNILIMKENPRARIRVAGYTSASGTEAYNQKLSERRAKSVQDFLVNEGVIKRERLSTVGYGEANPVAYEATPEKLNSAAAKANIRVLFEIVEE